MYSDDSAPQTINTHIAGYSFRSDEDRNVFRGLGAGAVLQLQPEPTNEFDKNAVQVRLGDKHFGFIPRHTAPRVKHYVESDEYLVECFKKNPTGLNIVIEITPRTPEKDVEIPHPSTIGEAQDYLGGEAIRAAAKPTNCV